MEPPDLSLPARPGDVMTGVPSATSRRTVALEAARAGASVADAAFRTELVVETKASKTDVVTQADRDAQRAVFEVIEETFPDEPIVGEEADAPKTVPESGPAWIVDPIDGTANFVRGLPLFATAVASVIDGEPVATAIVCPALDDGYRVGTGGPVRNGRPISVSTRSDPEACAVCPTLWWGQGRRGEYSRATRAIVSRFGDLRRFGSAQLELATVAAGGLDATVTNVVANPWDTVAGVHLVRAAGGTVTDLDGERWRHDSTGLVASNGAIHEEALAAANEIDG